MARGAAGSSVSTPCAQLMKRSISLPSICSIVHQVVRIPSTSCSHSRTNTAISPQEELRRMRESRSEEHTSELQSLMRSSYAVFCLKKNNKNELTDQYKINTQT